MTTITDNAAKQRYELIEQGQTAFADYRLAGNRLYIDYVFSPPALRGAGTAGRLMAGLAIDARRRSLKITPICGYAAAWLSRHPEYADLTG
jgi:predicted GNAT family acetyltransferase